MLKSENLMERDVTELAIPEDLGDEKTIEKVRDILRGCCIKTANGITYLIVGIENQKDFQKFKTELGAVLEFISDAAEGERLEKALEKRQNDGLFWVLKS